MSTNSTGKETGNPSLPLSTSVANAVQSEPLRLPQRGDPVRPEFYRLPKSGGDPYFNLGRSFYYEGEKRGYWKLVRIRERGKERGVTLVPYDAVAAFVRKQMEGAK